MLAPEHGDGGGCRDRRLMLREFLVQTGEVVEAIVKEEFARHLRRDHGRGGLPIIRVVDSEIDRIIRKLEDGIELGVVAEEFGYTPSQLQAVLVKHWQRRMNV